jgi:hypothetical protein
MKIFKLFKKLFIFSVIFLFIIFLLSRGKIYNSSELSYGITFSQKQAVSLGLDWQKLYLDIINDLKIKKIRLPAYWDEIEKNKGQFNFNDLDWQINEAKLNNADIILAIGGRLPRWPECHYPNWTNSLDEFEREEEILNYIKKTIERYKDYENIIAWQIENEPFLNHFGDCPKLNKNLLDKEISIAKNLDNRPILITDSGELSVWIPAAKRGDWFGTTMYRDTYSGNLKRYIHYPIAPGFFRFKKNITRIFSNPKKWLVIELQAEPWGPLPYQKLSEAERSRTMNLQKLKEMIDFSSQTGFDEFYLWGVEWWAWEKEKNNNPALWEEAKKLF